MLGYKAGPEQLPDAPDRRVVPLPPCGSSLPALEISSAGEQQEVNGHEPARPDVSQGTQATRPSALSPLEKSSMARAVARALVEESRMEPGRDMVINTGRDDPSSCWHDLLNSWTAQLLSKNNKNKKTRLPERF